ncbi:hypothetical protein Hypma_014930 [Hypsizygus marmoreus]|uniref:Uncharacterized protein n=1 Tax=Hypsizygus marmoreus TaxID=39966 RepID=A0A369K6P6_HYPMA|nr:hypothetical protein Hypma_014930 [Hypsizygus marmoreus]
MFLRSTLLVMAISLGVYGYANTTIKDRSPSSSRTLTWIAPNISNQTPSALHSPFGEIAHSKISAYPFAKMQIPFDVSLEDETFACDSPTNKNTTLYHSQSLNLNHRSGNLLKTFQSHKLLYVSLFVVSTLAGVFVAAWYSPRHGPLNYLSHSHDIKEVHQKIAHHPVLNSVFILAAPTDNPRAPSSQNTSTILSFEQSTSSPSPSIVKDTVHDENRTGVVSLPPVESKVPSSPQKAYHEQREFGIASPKSDLSCSPVRNPSTPPASFSPVTISKKLADADFFVVDEDVNNLTLVDDMYARSLDKSFRPRLYEASSYPKDWVTFEAPVQLLASTYSGADDNRKLVVEARLESIQVEAKAHPRTMRSVGTMTTGLEDMKGSLEILGRFWDALEKGGASRTLACSLHAPVTTLITPPPLSKPGMRASDNTRPKGWCICGMHEPKVKI